MCISAAEELYPGSGDFIQSAFELQKQFNRNPSGSCNTGPSLGGPPRLTYLEARVMERLRMPSSDPMEIC